MTENIVSSHNLKDDLTAGGEHGSQAKVCAEWLTSNGATADSLPTLGIPAPSSISHHNYAVGYFADNSILVWARGEGLLILDSPKTCYRETVEHLARCLGTFSKTQRAAMVQGSHTKAAWIDGIRWGLDGEYLGM